MADKYHTSTRRIYEIWKRHAQGLSQRKQQISDPFTTNPASGIDEHYVHSRHKALCRADNQNILQSEIKEEPIAKTVGAELVNKLYSRRMEIKKALREAEKLIK
ncbi:2088_t:CDS:1 [Paraglomus brasilianum]|uniref:2088_t:CDS:1 n=1 Tax=Paraglomus brasilianum TaxID=144538 RepID=A0A9N9GIX6_9GLOM|nr:2088_t:CDS:1 [Paraglomus brasilianum]